jgi:hypothetical protein
MFPQSLLHRKIINKILADNLQNGYAVTFMKRYLSESKRKNKRVNKWKNPFPKDAE